MSKPNNQNHKKDNYNKKKIQDLNGIIELKDGEIDELNISLSQKDKEINALKSHIAKFKFEKQKMELKLSSEVNNEKAKLKELDDLQVKINEKVEIIEDKQDQVKYLRSLIDDYKVQIENNTVNLETQLRKISKTYEGLLEQKDMIINKQDENIKELIESKEHIIKANKTNMISLELQNENYRKIIDKFEK